LVIASICGIVSSFVLGKNWVWNSSNRKSISRFVMLQFMAISVNWIILHFVSLTIFPRQIAQIFIYIIQAAAFYFLNKNYIFKPNL